MNIFRRAGLYLIRKKVRSVLLFLILLSMGVFMLTGFSIRQSAGRAAEDMRRSISTGLNIEMLSLPGDEIYDLSYNEEGDLVRSLKIPLITESVAEELASIDGVSGYYSEMGAEMLYTGLQVHPGGFALSMEQSRESQERIPEEMQESNRRQAASNDFRIVQESEYYPYFRNGAMELSEGRHLHREDSGKILISEELALRNNLSVGDFIEGQNFDLMSGELYGEVYRAEIAGIFRINFEQQLSDWIAEPNILANTVFAPFELRHWGQVQYNTFYGGNVLALEEDRLLGSITIYVDDPDDLGRVMEEIKGNEHVDWSCYSISRYDKDYRAAAKPLLTMVLLATLLVVIMMAGALVILSLVLAMWMHSRRQEMNLLRSLGIRERTILAQFLLETSMIVLPAFLLAFVLAGPAARIVGDAWTEFTNPSVDAAAFEAAYEIETGVTYIDRAPVRQEPLSYALTFRESVLTFLAMMAVALGTVFVTFMRLGGERLRLSAAGVRRRRFGKTFTGPIHARHRAWLYVTRKTGKSALLLVTLSVMVTLLLLGTSICLASGRSAAQLREHIGGYFRITPDYSRPDAENQINLELPDRIMEIGGIKAFSALDICYMDTSEFAIRPGKFSAEGDEKAHQTRVLGNTDTSLHEYFSLGILELTQGRHVKEADTGKALISEELAKLNQITLGDHLTLHLPKTEAEGASEEFYDLEIIGLFEEVQKTPVSGQTPEYDIPSNFIFTDIASTRQMVQTMRPERGKVYTGGAIFFVKDPEKIGQVVQTIEEAELFDPEYTKITVNNAAYQNSMEPLTRLGGLSLLMLVLTVITGLTVLTLILILRERDRIYEAGILMSFGISRRNIWWQHFLECTFVFFAAFCISAGILLAAGQRAGDWLYSQIAEETEAKEFTEDLVAEGAVNADLINRDFSFDARMRPGVLGSAALVGILVIGLSTGTAFWAVARRRPKELLAMIE